MFKPFKVFANIDTVHGYCEECGEDSILVAIVSDFYRCTNCGMGFVITPINLQGECPHCGYINSPLVLEEDNMIKKIWEKLKSWICFWK